MRGIAIKKGNEHGVALVELAIGATVFFTALFAVLEFSRLLWTHNALADAARQGVRYAAINRPGSTTQVRNVVVYGMASPPDGAKPIVYGLMTNQVAVSYSSNFGVKQGSVTVSITGYAFNFSIPLIGTTLTMPDYINTLTGESAGYEPSPL